MRRRPAPATGWGYGSSLPWPSSLLDVERGVERVETRRDRGRGAARGSDRLDRFQPVTGDVHDDTFVGPYDAVGRKFLQRRDRHSARRFGEDAFGVREEFHPGDDLTVAHRRESAVAVPYRVEREVAVGRVSDRE